MSIIYQIWQCISCGEKRIWGSGVNGSPTYFAPFLVCDTCKKVTRFTFAKHKVKDEDIIEERAS